MAGTYIGLPNLTLKCYTLTRKPPDTCIRLYSSYFSWTPNSILDLDSCWTLLLLDVLAVVAARIVAAASAMLLLPGLLSTTELI